MMISLCGTSELIISASHPAQSVRVPFASGITGLDPVGHTRTDLFPGNEVGVSSKVAAGEDDTLYPK